VERDEGVGEKSLANACKKKKEKILRRKKPC
jgi:hypothetical protein